MATKDPVAPPHAAPEAPEPLLDLADDGDRPLIRWMLSMTPVERLGVVQRWARLVTRTDSADG